METTPEDKPTLAKSSTKDPKKAKKVTPLMQQYFAMKAQYPDAILLFRVGDFYETFGEDAEKASRILNIILTSRNNGGSDIPLAGFPYHSLDAYLPKLVRAGYRVAICEQLERPSKEKKIVKRGVTDVVTPGVTIDDTILNHNSNNYLCALHIADKKTWGIAFVDISTGEFLLSQGTPTEIEKLIHGFSPSEIIYAKSHKALFDKTFGEGYYTYNLDEWVFTEDHGREQLLEHFNVKNLKGYGVDQHLTGQVAAGAILYYLGTTQNDHLQHLTGISRIQSEQYVWLDRFTIRNLELVHSVHETGKPLIDVLDKTVTPMGGRLLRRWVILPLLSVEKIGARHNMVDYFYNTPDQIESYEAIWRRMGDIERLVSKVAMERINPRELHHLFQSIKEIPAIKQMLLDTEITELVDLSEMLNECAVLRDDISKALSDEPPTLIAKGGAIKEGYNEELDEYRNIVKNAKSILLNIQQTEAENTGITNLKIGFNNVFGYYLEVTNKYKNQGLVPDNWVRKQTLTGSERYITDELKTLEVKILGAEDKIGALEVQLFDELVSRVAAYVSELQQNAHIIATVDAIISFAKVAIRQQYCKPIVNDSLIIDIKQGRHPVIEQQMKLDETYVPNDIRLDSDDTQVMMITGPNMSGKSAVLRQTALICLMAQMGSYVPAETATMGILDKIFTRVGASDNISSGESTFMLEMNETASIMNNMSNRSLILLDEIGRGTSTYDGISIAWSLAEYLHNHTEAKPKTLFATHYHELNELADKYPRIKNYNVATKEVGNKVFFLRKLVEGGCHHSFGIHVAQMAGMPKSIILRATEILTTLEQKSIESGGNSSLDSTETMKSLSTQAMQLSIFETADPIAGQLKEILGDIQLNQMTPIECMMKLHEMKKMLE